MLVKMTIAAVSKDERQSAGMYYIETTELCIELEGKRNGREKKVERFYWDEKKCWILFLLRWKEKEMKKGFERDKNGDVRNKKRK